MTKKKASPGAALAALRKKETIVCAHCGATAERYVGAKYCSRTCGWRAASKRNYALRRAAQTTKRSTK